MLSERLWKLDAVLRLLMQVLLSISIGVLLMLFAGGPVAKALSTDVEFVAQVLGFVSVQGLALVWLSNFLREHQLNWSEAFGFRNSPARSLGLALLTMLLALPFAVAVLGTVVALLLKAFGVAPEVQATISLIQKHPPAWQLAILGLVAVVIAPLAEEMLFRGVLYTTLKQRGYPRVALWGTAALFAAIHFNVAAFLPLFFLALVFTWLYERTRNLLAPIAAHVLFNAANFFALVGNLPDWLEKTLKQ